MSVDGQKPYPGATATPGELVTLAHEYRRAAETLLPTGRRGSPLSRAPYRLIAIHAIELYLNAYLLASGYPSAAIRGLQHDLRTRTREAVGAKLVLRKRTLAHLCLLSEHREYLVTRYECSPRKTSELNRLAATLREVAEKVSAYFEVHMTRTGTSPSALAMSR